MMRKFYLLIVFGFCFWEFSCNLNTFTNQTVDVSESSSDYGTGPDVIPKGDREVGTSSLVDGSAARLALFGNPQYFWGKLGNGKETPVVRITHAISDRVVDIEVVFNPAFVDNTYGTGSIGWNPKRPHAFRDLHVSDHVELAVLNKNGDTIWAGRMDLLSHTEKVVSGYACLGPSGGDGVIYKGTLASVLSFGSSMDDNINFYGYHLFENSPITDSTYKPDPCYPNWQFFVTYRLTLDISAFGPSGYGEVSMTSVHASPGKNGAETIIVTQGPDPGISEITNPFRYYVPSKPVIPPDTLVDNGGVD